MHAMVRLWTEAIDQGWWQWDDNGQPIDTLQDVPTEVIRTELVTW